MSFELINGEPPDGNWVCHMDHWEPGMFRLLLCSGGIAYTQNAERLGETCEIAEYFAPPLTPPAPQPAALPLLARWVTGNGKQMLAANLHKDRWLFMCGSVTDGWHDENDVAHDAERFNPEAMLVNLSRLQREADHFREQRDEAQEKSNRLKISLDAACELRDKHFRRVIVLGAEVATLTAQRDEAAASLAKLEADYDTLKGERGKDRERLRRLDVLEHAIKVHLGLPSALMVADCKS